MPRDHLIAEYTQLLSRSGLTLDDADAAQRYEGLRAVDEIRANSIPDLRPTEQATREAKAQLLAESGGTWNFRIQNHVPFIIRAAEAATERLNRTAGTSFRVPDPEDLFVGEFPTDHFSAVVRRSTVGPGHLVLVNAGLCDLVSHASALLSAARTQEGCERPHRSDLEPCARYVIGLSRKYQTRGVFFAVNDGPTLNPTQFDHDAGDWVSTAAMAFIVAHEVAHIILRHWDPGAQNLHIGLRGVSTTHPDPWRMEFSADALGALILDEWCMQAFGLGRVPTYPAELAWAHALLAPIFFLQCQSLVLSGLGCGREGGGSAEHPSPASRQRFLLNLIAGLSTEHRAALGAMRPERLFLRHLRGATTELWESDRMMDVAIHCGGLESFKGYLRGLMEAHRSLPAGTAPVGGSRVICVDPATIAKLGKEPVPTDWPG